jgi:predicted GIY-YIG superfamily endonuclease
LVWVKELEQKMTIGVYAVQNKITGKAYIGSSKHVELRLRHHKCYIKTGLFLHYQGYAEDAKKYGVDAFEFKLLAETSDVLKAQELETEIIKLWQDSLYNKAPNANGATGVKRNKSIYVAGAAKRLANPDYIKRLSEACKGKREIVECPYCGLKGGGGNMRRYHFDNCKAKK